MMDDFDRNWRRAFEKRMRPVADRLYWRIIPGLQTINRCYRVRLPLPLHVELGVLDRELGIDVIFTLSTGMRLTCQEKFGSPEFAYLRDVTVEYYNEPLKGVPGDWFHLISQLYFFGFATKDEKAFDPWVLLDWPQVVLETQTGTISWERMVNTKDGAKADFMRCWMDEIPEGCILAASWQQTVIGGEKWHR